MKTIAEDSIVFKENAYHRASYNVSTTKIQKGSNDVLINAKAMP